MTNRNLAERRNQIAKIILRDGSVRVAEIAKMFNVSTETIRKDLIYFENEGLLQKNYGGAMAKSEIMVRSINSRIDENTEIKNRIAERALDFLPEKGVIFLDSGTTTLCFAKQLVAKSDLTIITNSVMIANSLAESKSKVHLTGGEFLGVTMALVGLWTNSAVKSIRPNVAYIGSSGVLDHSGPSAETFLEAEVKKNILQSCNTSVVLMDSTKFNNTAIVEFAQWKDIDYLITDKGISKETYRKLSASTKIILV